MGNGARRFSRRDVLRLGDANGKTGDCLVLMVLSSTILAVLLKIGGIWHNPVLVLVVENTVRLLRTGAAGIYSQESNMNCVNCGIIIVVEA